MRKRIVVLANSVKHAPGRCIAGREVLSDFDSPLKIGPWIRPVSTFGEGELYLQHFMLKDGTEPQPLDVIDIQVDAPAKEITQPENWLITQNGDQWCRVNRCQLDQVRRQFLEHPYNLWLQPGVKSDRVEKSFLALHPPAQSLYLLDVQGATVTANGKKFRISFSFNGTHYNLAITDPQIADLIGESPPFSFSRCLICVSLAPPFLNEYDGREYHFKVAATIFPYE